MVQRDGVHLEEQFARRPLDAAGFAQRPIEPEMRLDPVDGFEVAALGGIVERIFEFGHLFGDFGAVAARDRGADQHQPDGAAGVLDGEIDGERAAHRAADEHGGMDAQPVEHGFEIDQMAERHVAGLGLAKAAPVIGNDVVALFGQRPHLLGPHAAVGDAGVEEHHRNAKAIRLAAQHGAVERDLEGGRHGEAPGYATKPGRNTPLPAMPEGEGLTGASRLRI